MYSVGRTQCLGLRFPLDLGWVMTSAYTRLLMELGFAPWIEAVLASPNLHQKCRFMSVDSWHLSSRFIVKFDRSYGALHASEPGKPSTVVQFRHLSNSYFGL